LFVLALLSSGVEAGEEALAGARSCCCCCFAFFDGEREAFFVLSGKREVGAGKKLPRCQQ
jgi:hypothetical protein